MILLMLCQNSCGEVSIGYIVLCGVVVVLSITLLFQLYQTESLIPVLSTNWYPDITPSFSLTFTLFLIQRS
jgi:hypothetical protein